MVLIWSVSISSYIPIGFHCFTSSQRIVCSGLMSFALYLQPILLSERRKEREEGERERKDEGGRKKWRGENRNEQSE